jgi:hypothetical protein
MSPLCYLFIYIVVTLLLKAVSCSAHPQKPTVYGGGGNTQRNGLFNNTRMF